MAMQSGFIKRIRDISSDMEEIRMGISELTALELGKEIKEKRISVREAVQASLERIHKYEDTVHAYVTLTEEAALAQADEIQNSCLQKLAAGALLRARHLLCTGGETAVLDRLADRAAELYQPHKDHITQDARLRSLGGQIQKMRAAEESMPARTVGQQAELADGWLHTAAAAMAADVSCMLEMSGRENTQAEEEEYTENSI